MTPAREIKNKKTEVEARIGEAILDFEVMTGMLIEEITIRRHLRPDDKGTVYEHPLVKVKMESIE